MAAIDYHAILEGIRDQIEADEDAPSVTIHIEEELSTVEGPTVMLYLDRRDAPDDLQTLSAGQRTRYEVTISIWCFGVAMDSMREACRNRDNLLGEIEIALMKDRTLQETVSSSWFTGGEFISAQAPGVGGFVSGAEIVLVALVTAITT